MKKAKILALFLIISVILSGSYMALKNVSSKNMPFLKKIPYVKDMAFLKEEAPPDETPQENVVQPLENVPAPVASVPAASSVTQPKIKLNPFAPITASPTLEFGGSVATGNRVFINNKEAQTDFKGTFKEMVKLVPGENTIKIGTMDKYGFYTEELKTVKFEPIPPKLVVVAPESSTSESVVISGIADLGTIVYVNDNKADTDRNGNFTSSVTLEPGQNTIKITATDKTGVAATLQKNINFIVKDPKLVVVLPDQSFTEQIKVSGITDENTVVIVFLNENKTDVNNSNGLFSGTLKLREGENKILVQAANKWGRTSSYEKTVVYQK